MTEKHVVFTDKDIDGLTGLGISRVVVELSQTGVALREIGFDSSGKAVYRFPGEGRFGERGLFDNAVVSMSQLPSDMSPDEFDKSFEMAGSAQD
jgi:hypothetical protein